MALPHLPTAEIAGTIVWNETTWNPNLTGQPDVGSESTITALLQIPSPDPDQLATTELVGTGNVTSVASKLFSFQHKSVRIFTARFQIFGLVPEKTVSVNVQLGAAFQVNPGKISSTAVAMPTDSDQVTPTTSQTVTSNWVIQILPNSRRARHWVPIYRGCGAGHLLRQVARQQRGAPLGRWPGAGACATIVICPN